MACPTRPPAVAALTYQRHPRARRAKMRRYPIQHPNFMPTVRLRLPLALALSLGVHAGLLLWAVSPPAPPQEAEVLRVSLTLPPPPEVKPVRPVTPKRMEKQARAPDTPPPPAPPPATMAAPPAPTAEDWQLASTYTLKNSKRYRHTWGQQVRSMMGTAVEGVNQGQVRFRITINPDGTLAQVEELWSTSEKVSALARQAIQGMPPLPPTPTGQPLVFEKTIAFMPYETGWPPSYKYDCLPDPPQFKNPFAWNGASGQQAYNPPPARAERDPDCHPSDVTSTFEEEETELKRQMERNRWGW